MTKKNRFDTKAADWDKKKVRVELAAAIAQALAELPLSTGMQAMEYGCGTGLVGLALAPRLGSLVAADSSAGMLDVLKQKIEADAIANVTPLLLDLATDSYEKQHDLVFSAMTLHHVDNIDILLKKFAAIIPSGGILAIADLDEEDGSFHQGKTEGVHHHGFNRAALAATLKKHGFVDIHFRSVHTLRRQTAGARDEKRYPVFLLTACRS